MSNYYDDADEGHAAPESKSPGGEGDSDEGKTALIPKSIFSKELQPGDKCDVTIVRVHEDSYEVEGCEGEEDKEEQPEEAAAPSGDEGGGDGGGMSSMME